MFLVPMDCPYCNAVGSLEVPIFSGPSIDCLKCKRRSLIMRTPEGLIHLDKLEDYIYEGTPNP